MTETDNGSFFDNWLPPCPWAHESATAESLADCEIRQGLIRRFESMEALIADLRQA